MSYIHAPAATAWSGDAAIGPYQAGWHDSTDISSFLGLPGTFLWFEQPFMPAWITFQFNIPGAEGFAGAYELRRLSGVVERGTFQTVPSTHSISGHAHLALSIDGISGRVFMVAGVLMDAASKIWLMSLGNVETGFPPSTLFYAFRVR